MSFLKDNPDFGRCILNGSNHVIDDKKKLEEYILKGYDAECGSGFYTIQDIEIAEKYARECADTFGGNPVINFYSVNMDKIETNLTTAIFDDLEEESTMIYLSHNISGKLPDFCEDKESFINGTKPRNICYSCNKNCKWNAKFIYAVLSDGKNII